MPETTSIRGHWTRIRDTILVALALALAAFLARHAATSQETASIDAPAHLSVEAS